MTTKELWDFKRKEEIAKYEKDEKEFIWRMRERAGRRLPEEIKQAWDGEERRNKGDGLAIFGFGFVIGLIYAFLATMAGWYFCR